MSCSTTLVISRFHLSKTRIPAEPVSEPAIEFVTDASAKVETQASHASWAVL
jgi:hypothetical protein